MITFKSRSKKFLSPIQIKNATLKKREYYDVYYGDKAISELSPLGGLHSENLIDAQKQANQLYNKIFNRKEFIESLKLLKLEKLELNKFGFGLLSNFGLDEKSIFPSVRFSIELAILNLIDCKNYPKGETCLLDFNNYSEDLNARFIKIKIGRDSIENDIIKINKYVNNTKFLLRLDGNNLFKHDELIELLDKVPLNRIHYIEDPFISNIELKKFEKNSPIHVPIALDENIQCLLKNSSMSPWVQYAIIKPNLLGGISQALWLNSQLTKRSIKTVISSSFEGPIGISGLHKIHHLFPHEFTEVPGLDTLRYFL